MHARQVLGTVVLSIVMASMMAGCDLQKSAPVTAYDPQAATLALVNATLIDGTGADPVQDAVVLIAGERILAIGPSKRMVVPAGVPKVDLGGATILPGFINAHVHIGFDKANLQAWALGGVTTVRDEGASPQKIDQLEDFRAEVAADPTCARLISAGTMITVPGGYGDLYVSSPEEARQAVFDELEAGVDMIKVSLEDGYAGQHDLPKLTPEQLKAIVSAAHERGTLVSGHITQAAYLQPMLEAGVDDIAHLPYDEISKSALQQMVAQSVTLVPTFTVFRNYGAPAAGMQENLRRFVKLGGRVALGNDYGGGPGDFELGIPMYEIQMMSQSGMTPLQIITASTLNAARASAVDGELGSLEAGKIADILVVGGDPLQDLKALLDVRMVIHAGVIIRE